MNYGEILAFWYLRLNGFIVMRDFVLHRGPSRNQASDIDLLAVRLPYAYERIGGQPCDLDPWFRHEAGVSLVQSSVAVMAESEDRAVAQ